MFRLDGDLERSALALVHGEKNLIANLANLSSLFYHSLPDLNWAGFYLWDEGSKELVLGPFQGKPACIRIPPERGVCGKAYSSKLPQLVPEVDAFPGHIACDSDSRSELVIPILKNGKCLGVLDLDSPRIGRFSEDDLVVLASLMEKLTRALWP